MNSKTTYYIWTHKSFPNLTLKFGEKLQRDIQNPLCLYDIDIKFVLLMDLLIELYDSFFP